MVEIKSTPTGVKVAGKLYNSADKLSKLFAESPKGLNRKVRKALHASGKRNLAAVY